MADKPDLDSAYALNAADDNRQFYRDWAASYDEVFVAETSYQLPDMVAATYLQLAGEWPCLDAGCGTGALGEHLAFGAVVDGVDLSSDMLAVAATKGRYRNLVEANLKEQLPFDDGEYAGLISSGTFTHGHVGPEAFDELTRILRSDALAVISIKPEVWESHAFGPAFDVLVGKGLITGPEIAEVNVYRDPTMAPDGHGDDRGLIVTFRKV
ncbi:MAG: methyltransferase domain-containing protein [Boseongicola sp.]|nr:MAG: methyltransferase domain-containing protein [Boseongicola sp.]